MERQKRKLKGIADLYNIEDERQRRQPVSEEDVPQQNISREDISEQSTSQPAAPILNISPENISSENTSINPDNSSTAPLGSSNTSQDIPKQDISYQDIPSQDISQPTTWSSNLVDTGRGYFPVYNDVTDRVIRELKLDVYEQSVLLKLYRESRGWKSDECELSHTDIVRSCNISKSQSQRTLAKLSSRGLVVNLGRAKSGPERNRYKVLPGVPVIPSQNIFSQDISCEGQDIVPQNTLSGQDIFCQNTHTKNNKDINTHTQGGVGVGSRFSPEECRRFAEHLQKTGQGINNPGGYATTIFRSGEADAQIEAFLSPPAPFKADACPDCGGTGYYYPEGVEKGVKICKHEKLKDTKQE